MMNKKVYFFTIFLLFLLASCSHRNENASAQKEVVFDDGYKTTVNGEVIIEDKSLEDKKETPITTVGKFQKTNRIASDGSQIAVSYDGFGNKTEIRSFNNNLLVKLILLRTSNEGDRQVFVYGRNGEVKKLPVNMFDKTLTASADELAKAAGIEPPNEEQPSLIQNIMPQSITDLQPLSSSQLSTPKQQDEQPPAEEVEKPADQTEKKAKKDENSQTPVKTDSITQIKIMTMTDKADSTRKN